MLTDRQILEVRSHFPLLREKTWLYNCSQGALSDAVHGALKDYAQSWRTSMDPWRDWVGAYEALRADFARFIGAEPDEVAKRPGYTTARRGPCRTRSTASSCI